MPALNYDYDYYEYARSRTRTVPTATRASRTTTSNKTTTRTNTSARAVTRTTTASRQTSKPTTRQVSKPVRKANNGINVDVNIKSKATRALANKPQEMTLKKPRAVRKTKKQLSLKVVLKAVVLLSVFFAICYRYSLINEKFDDIRKVQDELAVSKTVNEQIQSEIETNTDLKYVENYAKYQLGMQKPSASQIQYINIAKQDKIIAPVTIEDETNDGVWEKIVSKVANYFGE